VTTYDPDDSSGTRTLIDAMITALVAPDATRVEIRRREGGEQGFSGATLRYYDVTYCRQDEAGAMSLVIKDAPLHERRTHMWLNTHGLPVPLSYTRDLTTDAPAPLCMQFIEGKPTSAERGQIAPHTLAAIHYAAMGHGNDLPWVPRADAAFFEEIVANWREPWHAALHGPEAFATWGAQHPFAWGAMQPKNSRSDFAAAFAAETPLLETAANRFLRDMTTLWDESDALTLIHADFHGEHIRVSDGRGYVIDWGQARYGPLYIDLPNYFPMRDDALRYRDALAALGHDIARDVFLARYAAARAYPGFKYFGFAFHRWFYGNPPYQRDDVQYWINMVRIGPDKREWAM